MEQGYERRVVVFVKIWAVLFIVYVAYVVATGYSPPAHAWRAIIAP